MNPIRRSLVTSLAAAPALLLPARFAWAADPLKISHQFPGGSEKEGDFRHRLCVKFAQELDKRSNGALKANVYPGIDVRLTSGTSPPAYTSGISVMSSAPLRTALNWAFTFISDEPG